MIFVNEDISSKLVSKHTLPDDIEGMLIEIKLRKTKWLILWTYHPPNQPDDYFFKAAGNVLDRYLKSYEKFLLLGDFNTEDIKPILSEFLEQYEAKSIMKNKTCFKNPDRPTCIDLFSTNSSHSFQNTMTITIGLSDFHKMVITVLKSSFIKLKARETYYRDYKNFSCNSFREDLILSLDRMKKGFDSFEDTFMKTLNRHAPMKRKLVRANEVLYMTRALRKAIMKRSELESTYLKNKSYQNMKIYKKKTNFCSKLSKKERKKNYSKIDARKMMDNKTFWKTVTPFLSSKAPSLSRITLIENEAIISDDQKVAETLSKFFVKAVDKLEVKEFKNISNIDGLSDPVEIAIKKYENHPSIVAVAEKFNFTVRFEFEEVNLKDIEKEILNLNTKKAVASNSIAAKVLNETSDVCSPVVQQIWNDKIFKKFQFLENLKLADITLF